MRVAYVNTHTHTRLHYILFATHHNIYVRRIPELARRSTSPKKIRTHLDLCVPTYIFLAHLYCFSFRFTCSCVRGMVIVVVHTFWTGKIRIICIYGGTGLVYIIYKDPFKIVFLVKRFKYLVRGRLARAVWDYFFFLTLFHIPFGTS